MPKPAIAVRPCPLPVVSYQTALHASADMIHQDMEAEAANPLGEVLRRIGQQNPELLEWVDWLLQDSSLHQQTASIVLAYVYMLLEAQAVADGLAQVGEG